MKNRKLRSKDLRVSNEIFYKVLDLPEAKRAAFISQECAKVIIKLIKKLRIKQGKNVRLNFTSLDMKDFKYFFFYKKEYKITDCNFLIEGNNYILGISKDGVTRYGVYNNDYLRILDIYTLLSQKYEYYLKRSTHNLFIWRKRRVLKLH